MNQKEIWRDVKDYEGIYQVSNLGRVKSLDRKVRSKNLSFRLKKQKILTPSLSNNYLGVILSVEDNQKRFNVHRLVVTSFIGDIPNGLVVNHINFNKIDNRLKNLEIVSQRDNANRKHCKSTSKYVGVSWDKSKNRWASQITIKSKIIKIGVFVDEKEASDAYQEKLKTIL